MKYALRFSSAMLILLLAHGEFATPARAAKSIVGTWSQSPTACKNTEEQVRIGALKISSNFMNCQFVGVSRAGNIVTWTGHCYSPEGNRRPETGEDGEVSARLEDNALTIDGLGLGMGPLVRCD